MPTSILHPQDSPRTPRGVQPIMGRRLLMTVPPPPSPEVAMRDILMSISPPPTPPRVSAKKTKTVLGRPPLPPPPPPPTPPAPPSSPSYRNSFLDMDIDREYFADKFDYADLCEKPDISKLTFMSSISEESNSHRSTEVCASDLYMSSDSLENF